MNLHLWQKGKWKNAYPKVVGLCHRYKGMICTKKEEGVSIIKRRKGRSAQVYNETAKKGVYLTLKISANSTSVFCRKEEWQEVDGPEL